MLSGVLYESNLLGYDGYEASLNWQFPDTVII
jgi:hypothetical protein